ncbi:tyrosine-type recombinase/integrase [Candidatus Contubernalis alkaliaceticus]|uniref:tyrosine-type recombinase/integrase n=1 Tax=Candidatus Contubernalis alkaliaceticus TaxID=338645 RepID=UPI001F4C4E07|nr:tyrosine-type recombinase/integrase [Candidatus Contubernalis alkalaceticus]UNC92135.1 tyrosine-type recombinase/integrase [Candidatus Contubernalis alkalaceticus]
MRGKANIYDQDFDGPFSECCHRYVDYKKSLGFKMGDSIFYLIRGMNRFFKPYKMTPDALVLTQEMVEDYVAYRPDESTKTQHIRMSFIRQFALFMNRTYNHSFYVYPLKDFVKIRDGFVPYIFTHDEIDRLAEVVDLIPESKRYPQYHIIYPMLFRMLYGCGLRINEALGLTVDQIDVNSGIIHLKDSKNGCERLLPMSISLTHYCWYYMDRMNISNRYNGLFYPSYYGGEYNSTPVYCQMRKFMKQASIYRSNGTSPRVHDLRHTFAVHALEKMVAEGMDIYCSLPILSQYLGHRGIESTEKYLRLTESAYHSIIDPMQDFYGGIFPEVPHE